jgi:pseudaminic acid synthase
MQPHGTPQLVDRVGAELIIMQIETDSFSPLNRVSIAGRAIGACEPVYVVAELSANHLGSLERALELMRAAHAAGADAIKIQTYTPESMTLDLDHTHFKAVSALWKGRRLYDLYREAQTPYEWHGQLFAEAARLGIPLFSSPFDPAAVDFLQTFDVPAYKIASFELVDLPLIARAAATGRPLIMSTGMSTYEEVVEAVDCARSHGCREFVILKCTSAYPAPPEAMNLRTIPDLAQRLGVPVGLSDHTQGVAVPVAAVALGATFIEKHLTLRRADGGPDAEFSLEPDEFKMMVDAVRVAEKALGVPRYEPTEQELKSRNARRSLYVVKPIATGESFSLENVRSIRPGYGLPPKDLSRLLGRVARQPLTPGTPLNWELVA